MQVPLQIAFHNVEGSDVVKGLIEDKVAWLERFYDRITGCRVVVEVPHQHHRRGNLYQVRIDLTVPGGEVVVNREPSQRAADRDLSVAIQHAFSAVRRQLEEHVRRQRMDVKSHEVAPRAHVSQLYPGDGFGFLRTAEGREVFFHRHALRNGDFGHLRVGTEVTFVETAGEKGPQATTVRQVGRHNQR